MKTLDLHGVKHADVPQLIDQFIWEQMNKNSKEIEIRFIKSIYKTNKCNIYRIKSVSSIRIDTSTTSIPSA